MRQHGFPIGVASSVTGLSVKQVRTLAAKNIVLPSLGGPSGPGSMVRYSFFDLLCLRVVERLRAGGDISFGQLTRAASELEKLRGGGWSQRCLVTYDCSVFELYPEPLPPQAVAEAGELLVVVRLLLVDRQLRQGLGAYQLGAPADPGGLRSAA